MPSLFIGARTVGADDPAYLIAEIGSNHDGSVERALELISAAADAGADAVKFQSFTADGLTRRGEPAFEILERLSIPNEWHRTLRDGAAAAGVDFLSTPFDEAFADLLFSLGVPAFKIASGDLTHEPLLRHVAGLGRTLILSTGLASLTEVRRALEVIADAGAPGTALLHCCAAYPTPYGELNLRAIQTLANEFGVVVGLSDHSEGHAGVLAGIALGARIIEKHVTFDRNLAGPDHSYALTFPEFAAMARDVRRVEAALGDGRKRPTASESPGLNGGRRSVHAASEIPAGTPITKAMLKIVRPADGISPQQMPAVVGRQARRALRSDEPITWNDLS